MLKTSKSIESTIRPWEGKVWIGDDNKIERDGRCNNVTFGMEVM